MRPALTVAKADPCAGRTADVHAAARAAGGTRAEPYRAGGAGEQMWTQVSRLDDWFTVPFSRTFAGGGVEAPAGWRLEGV